MADAEERAQVRARFRLKVQREFQDPDLVQDALDDFDRGLFSERDEG